MPITTTDPRLNRACSRCGAALHCGAVSRDEHCWCESLPPLEPIPGQGCLCRSCLEKALGQASHAPIGR
ncbi:MAG TPA: cysteine-rich CWC family protein [Burkholderiales bacterium]|nr:cysteine-rich CWC family protein [Burkholderiales bacterium]